MDSTQPENSVAAFAGQESRAELVRRIERNVSRELTQMEARLTRLGLDAGRADHESAVRVLAQLARTVRVLASLDAAIATTEDDDEPTPRDIDKMREEIAERLERLHRERQAAGGPFDP